jgi:hypothetical protein
MTATLTVRKWRQVIRALRNAGEVYAADALWGAYVETAVQRGLTPDSWLMLHVPPRAIPYVTG